MRVRQPEIRSTMSSDQLLASVERAAAVGIARDEVVVPLRAPVSVASAAPRLGQAAGAHAAARSVVAQITDYFHRERRRAAPEPAALLGAARPQTAAPTPAAITAHAGELNRLLRQQIESHLDLIAARAPDLAQPVDNVRRSVELLLKLRR